MNLLNHEGKTFINGKYLLLQSKFSNCFDIVF